MKKWENGKDLVFSQCVFGWKGRKIVGCKSFLFGFEEKQEGRKYSLYKFTIMTLVYNM